MKRITPALLAEARKMESSWMNASIAVGKVVDRDFIRREIAGLLQVSLRALIKRLGPPKS